ncbi:MATE family efflux transporter [Sphingomonas sanguinis]|uniref:MATE family efflux transporter n=1 Tax=Sphingomonas sanguinis TaxID=33051 RepID=A0ABU5LSW2_9SPHN|nr:MATE family efflux transporter [Sphingomonas sanguinis]
MTALAGWGGRIIAAISQFAVIPILTDMLGISGYGAFSVLTALLTWFALADLGFGSSLQNFISQARVRGENAAIAIRSTASLLAGLAVLLFIATAIAGFWAGPALLAGFGVISRLDAIAGFIVFALIAIGTGVSSVAIKICFAEHRGYIAHLSYVASGLLGLVGLLIVKCLDVSHPFVWAVGVYTTPGWLIPSALWLYQLRVHQDPVFPLRLFDEKVLASLWKSARIFLAFNILSVLVLNVDYLILSQTMAGPDVAIYAVYAKCYALAFFVFNSIIQAYWPVSAEMLHRHDLNGLKQTIRRCLGLGVTIVIAGTLGLYIFRPLIQHLLLPGSTVVLPASLLPLFALYWLIRVWSDTFAMVVLSADRGIALCIIVPAQAAINLALAYYGARHFGIPGLLIGTSLSFLFTVVWALPLYLRSHVRRLVQGNRRP